MNLLQETVGVLSRNGKSIEDVVWCGSEEFGYFSWTEFEELADKEYDDGYGSPKVCQDLLIVGENFWLERAEYDGSEWWNFKTMPVRPAVENIPRVIIDDSFMWVSLNEANA